MEKLGKPPIIEAWVGIRFEPGSNTPEWGARTAQQFLTRYASEFPTGEIESAHQVQIKEGPAYELPQIVGESIQIESVRLFNAQKSRWIQLLNGRLIYNIVAPGIDYPGFEVLCSESLPKLQDYIGYFQPRSIRAASLFYMDRVEIPFDGADSVRLDEFVKWAFDLPREPFGDTVQYRVQTVLDCPVDKGPLILSVSSLPVGKDKDRIVLQVEWQKICNGFESLDLEEVKTRLSVSRSYIYQCFRDSFTEKGWQLFEPYEQD